MNILYRAGLASLAAAACLIVMGPVLFVVASAATVVSLFALAVTIAAVVLYAERWVDEGLSDYSFMDALDDAFHAVVQFLIGRIYAAKRLPGRIRSLKARFVAFRPTLARRGRVVVALVFLPLIAVAAIVAEGFQVVRKDLRHLGDDIKDAWAHRA